MSTAADAELYRSRGWLGPLPVLTTAECRRLLWLLRFEERSPTLDWPKGRAATSRRFFEIARRRSILDAVAALLGDDLLLWGASLVTRRPGSDHSWHTDVESSMADGRTASVWIALENGGQRSGLRLMSHSQALGRPLQELVLAHGVAGRVAGDDEVLAWARALDPRCSVARPNAAVGEAVCFDGRLWHGSVNHERRARTALLLQYATPDTAIHMFERSRWPFGFLERPRPPCVVVRGTDRQESNRVVAPPTSNGGEPLVLSNTIRELPGTLPSDSTGGLTALRLLRGSTPNVEMLDVHVSRLEPGAVPHPPHHHTEEELLVVIDGELDVHLFEGDAGPRTRTERLHRGRLIHYRASQSHTLESVGADPATYLVLRWRVRWTRGGGAPLETSVFELAEPERAPAAAAGAGGRSGMRARRIFAAPTRYLAKLECHVTTLEPGAGYEPHRDAHDVAILLLSGAVETLGERPRAPALIFSPAGEPHGMRNVGSERAVYLVVELHAADSTLELRGEERLRHALRRVLGVARRLFRHAPQ